MTGYCVQKGLEGGKPERRPMRSVVSQSKQEMLAASLRMVVGMKGSGRVCEDSTGPGNRLDVGSKGKGGIKDARSFLQVLVTLETQ